MIPIEILPDDVLLEIFDFYVYENPRIAGSRTEAWQMLVHVCQRWRTLVFASPRYLDLQLYCTPQTPVKDKLDIWPALPLVVEGTMTSSGTDNVIAAVARSNRVSRVVLSHIEGGQFEKLLAAIQMPFPELTQMRLTSHDETLPVVPDSFLGGSAPSLVLFYLDGIPFPELPKLLLSANHLDTLSLTNIPHSGYISPEAIVALLAALPNLISLHLGFRSPQSRPDWRSRTLPPQRRSTLSLRKLQFKGVTEYLEELVTGIHTPQLDEMHITFFNQIDFDCPRLAQFINCTPKMRPLHEAHVQFDDGTVWVRFRSWTSSSRDSDDLEIGISCGEADWQLSFTEQICDSCSPSLSTIENLHIKRESLGSAWKTKARTIENAHWLQFLRPFTAVKNLYLVKELVPGIAAALQELAGGRNTEVLPSLENIFVEKLTGLTSQQINWFEAVASVKKEKLDASASLEKDIGQFLAARQLSGHPITISNLDTQK